MDFGSRHVDTELVYEECLVRGVVEDVLETGKFVVRHRGKEEL